MLRWGGGSEKRQLVIIQNTPIHVGSTRVIDDIALAFMCLCFGVGDIYAPDFLLERKNDMRTVRGESWHQDTLGGKAQGISALSAIMNDANAPTYLCDFQAIYKTLPEHIARRLRLFENPLLVDSALLSLKALTELETKGPTNFQKEGFSAQEILEIHKAWCEGLQRFGVRYTLKEGDIMAWDNAALYHRGVSTKPIPERPEDAVVRQVAYTGYVPRTR